MRRGGHARIDLLVSAHIHRSFTDPPHPMDIEQVNAIGTLLADLSARTEQLRGYL
jgi:hypothetical protein